MFYVQDTQVSDTEKPRPAAALRFSDALRVVRWLRRRGIFKPTTERARARVRRGRPSLCCSSMRGRWRCLLWAESTRMEFTMPRLRPETAAPPPTTMRREERSPRKRDRPRETDRPRCDCFKGWSSSSSCTGASLCPAAYLRRRARVSSMSGYFSRVAGGLPWRWCAHYRTLPVVL